MLIRFATILVIVFSIGQALMAQKVVGYFYASNSSYPHNVIDYENLTHIAHAFIYPTAEGEIKTDSWYFYPELVTEAKANGVKIITAIGGWGNSDGFPPMAADSVIRSKFIDNIVKFCKDHGYDGVDLDWEYPKEADRENFVSLVKELREAFDENDLEIVSTALPSSDWGNGYDITNLKNYLNWFGIMTYDFSGPWESVAGYNSPLYKHPRQWGGIHESIKYYRNKGVPLEKLLMGMAFYGYSFNASDPFKPHTGASSISYVKANNLKTNGYNYIFDEVSKVPYLQDENKTKFVTYDDSVSIKLKCEYVHSSSIGGTIIWKIGHDYVSGSSPLLSIVGKHLLGKAKNVPVKPKLLSPINGSEFTEGPIMFEWISDEWATSYELVVASDESLQNVVLNESGISLNEFIGSNLDPGKIYYWKIKANNLIGDSDWSEVYQFQLGSISSSDDDDTFLMQEFNLKQNYPNPFNPITTIGYTIPQFTSVISEQVYVTLKVYNILGETVETLVNSTQSSGHHTVKFDASLLPSGVYIYQLRAGTNLSSKKMSLLK